MEAHHIDKFSGEYYHLGAFSVARFGDVAELVNGLFVNHLNALRINAIGIVLDVQSGEGGRRIGTIRDQNRLAAPAARRAGLMQRCEIRLVGRLRNAL